MTLQVALSLFHIIYYYKVLCICVQTWAIISVSLIPNTEMALLSEMNIFIPQFMCLFNSHQQDTSLVSSAHNVIRLLHLCQTDKIILQFSFAFI